MDAYLQAIKEDQQEMEQYYRKSLVKTEQQKFLETLAAKNVKDNGCFADLGGGGYALLPFFQDIPERCIPPCGL